MLGWKITKSGEYRIRLPILSKEEEQAVLELEERFKEETAKNQLNREQGSEMFKRLIHEYSKDSSTYMDSDQMEYLASIAMMHAYGFYFIEELIKDSDIEEISIIGPGKPAYVFLRNKGWKEVNALFTDEKTISDAINKMASKIGRRITYQNPRIDAILPDGSRLHASLPPVSAGEISIRKFRERPFSAMEIAQSGLIDTATLAYLSIIAESDSSLIIAGNTASGKTTTMNTMFGFVPLDERIVIAEQTPEINIPHMHQVRMVANKEMEIGLDDVIYDTLRMRPDRIIVGEVRNKKEVEALFDVLLAGQARASYATMHARSSDELIKRLENFGVSQLDVRSLGFVAIQKRMMMYQKGRRKSEIRRITEICEMSNGNTQVFAYNNQNGLLKRKNEKHLDGILAQTMGLSEREINEMAKEREKLIEKSPKNFQESVKYIQKKLFGLEYGDY